MEPSQLASATVIELEPDSFERLYAQMTATALDFRALSAHEDRIQDLWELVELAQPYLTESVPMSQEESKKLADDMLDYLTEGWKFQLKSPSRISMEAMQRHSKMLGFYKRLRQLRHNTWFDVKLETVAFEDYRARWEEESRLLAKRLRTLDRSMP